MGIPFAPQHLRKETRTWWRNVAKEWALEDHEMRLLTLACETWDRILNIRERVEEDGTFIKSRLGELKPHPGLAEERRQKATFAKLLKELDLEVEPPQTHRRRHGR